MAKDLKVLVAGCGSIGRRHIANLRALGVRRFVLCDPSPRALEAAAGGLDRPACFRDFDAAAAEAPDAAFICSPSSMHMEMAGKLARAGVHLFIEKPLSNSLEGAAELAAEAELRGIAAMMGMCYRFHPVMARLREVLQGGPIGRIYHVIYHGGQYLPDWHPCADYRSEYAARKDLGGGVVLTTIHGLDDLRHLFGEVEDVAEAVTPKVSGLDLDVEDLVMAVLRMRSGAYVFWQTDFLQRAKQHRMVITGEKGTIRCDVAGGVLEVYDAASGAWAVEEIKFDVNSMYVDEAAHFLDCVENGKRPSVDIAEGVRTLKLALDVKARGERYNAALAARTRPLLERKGLRLRAALDTDMELLFKWRNDLLTRLHSVNTAEVAWGEHEAWFRRVLADPSVTLYVAEEGGAPVGTVRVEKRADGAELSWTVAPHARGRGVGKAMVKLAAATVKGAVRARIKAGNTASVRIARSAGFVLESEDGALGHWRLAE